MGKTITFAVIFEKGPTSYGAYVPDLPGCVAVAGTLDEVRNLIREAVQFHIEFMHERGDTIPPSTSLCEYVEVEIPEPAVTEPQPR
jgi:predicted RNase H-like HicB family nuclease